MVYNRILQAVKSKNKSLLSRFKKVKKYFVTSGIALFVVSVSVITMLLLTSNNWQKIEVFENIEKTAEQLITQIDTEQSNLLEKRSEQMENMSG